MARRVDFDMGLPWLIWIVPIMALMSFYGVYQSYVRLNYVKENLTSKTEGIISDFDIEMYQGKKYKSMIIDYIIGNDTLKLEQGIDFSEEFDYGDKVEILYNPINPNESEVNNENALYSGLKSSSLLAIIFSLTSGILILLYRRKQRKAEFEKRLI